MKNDERQICLDNEKKITRWLEDMNFNYLVLKLISYHSKIKFISLRRLVISFKYILYIRNL